MQIQMWSNTNTNNTNSSSSAVGWFIDQKQISDGWSVGLQLTKSSSAAAPLDVDQPYRASDKPYIRNLSTHPSRDYLPLKPNQAQTGPIHTLACVYIGSISIVWETSVRCQSSPTVWDTAISWAQTGNISEQANYIWPQPAPPDPGSWTCSRAHPSFNVIYRPLQGAATWLQGSAGGKKGWFSISCS